MSPFAFGILCMVVHMQGIADSMDERDQVDGRYERMGVSNSAYAQHCVSWYGLYRDVQEAAGLR